jgi:hypothetical protein
MLNKNYLSSLLLVFALFGLMFSHSCGARRTYQTKSPAGGFAQYVIVEVPDFKTSINPVPPEIIWKIPNVVADKLRKERLFTGVSRTPVDISDRVMIVDGTVVAITPTEWYKKIAGTGRVIATVRFIDKSENNVIAEASFEGTAEGGVFGGGMYFAYEHLADEIISYIRKNYSPQ